MRRLEQLMLDGKDTWWRRWLVAPIIAQLTSGISPEKLSWTVALGMVLGVFPVMGTTTVLCLIAGWALKLNQPVLHVSRVLVYPLHLLLIIVFIHFGQRLFGVPLLSFSIPDLLEKFRVSPFQFFQDFGMAALQGVAAWAIFALPATWLIQIFTSPLLRKAEDMLKKSQEEAV